MKKDLLIIIILIICMISSTSSQSKINTLNIISSKYDIILENIDTSESNYNKDQIGEIKAFKEITSNKQILIIPTMNSISSEEKYNFKEYFSKSTKDMLIGRLLVERFVGEESFFSDYLNSLPTTFSDYYHFDEKEQEEFQRRSLNVHSFENRRSNFDNLIRKIPSSEIPSQLLNYNLYNWASSIVECYSFAAQKQFNAEVKKLFKYSYTKNTYKESSLPLTKLNEEELLLIPGLNLFEQGRFNHSSGNNFSSSLFSYKEHIYLNSDRYVEEGEKIYNDIQFQSNINLFESCGLIINDYYHEELIIKLNNKNWTLIQFDLCKSIDCISLRPNYKNPSKLIANPTLKIKKEFDFRLLNICQIDQLNFSNDMKNSEEIFISTAKSIRERKRISNENYIKALSKCDLLIKEYLNISKKTSIEEDVVDFENLDETKCGKCNNRRIIYKYAISQKSIINSQLLMFKNRLIKEEYNHISGYLKKRYI